MKLNKEQFIRLKFKVQIYCYEECSIASKRDKFYLDCGDEDCEFYPLSPWADNPKPPHPDQIPLPDETVTVREIKPDLKLIIYPERKPKNE